MFCKVPIRTYGRGKCKEVSVSLQKLRIPEIHSSKEIHTPANQELNLTEKENDCNNSLFHDPFETTFDRLLKDTRDSKQPLKASIVKTSRSNEEKSFHLSNNVSVTNDHTNDLLLYNDTKKSDINVKPILRKKTNRKLKIKHEKKSMQKSIPISRVKEHNIYKKKVYRGRIKKEAVLNHSNDHSIHLSLEFKDHRNINKSKADKDTNTKHEKADNIKKVSEEQKESTEIIEANVNNLKYSNMNIRDCFVKIEKVETFSFIKPLSRSTRKFGNAFSSTPIGKPVRPSTHIIALSPIPITYSENVNKLVSHTDNSLVTVSNTNLVPSGNMQTNTNVCEHFDTLQQFVTEETKKLLFIDQKDKSDCNKCSLEELEGSQTNNIMPSVGSICNSNYKQDCIIQDTSEQCYDIKKAMSPSKVKDKDLLNVPSLLTTEEIITNSVPKKNLNFSIDAERSRSLFGNTNEDNGRSLSNVSSKNSFVKVSTSNLMLHESYKKLNKAIYPVAKIDKTSTLNTCDTEIKNKVEERSCDILPAIELHKINISVDAEDCKSKTKEIDAKNNNISISKETKDLGSSDNKLSANNSIVILTQLHDSFRITRRRKQYCKQELDLTDILEDYSNSHGSKRTRVSVQKVREIKRTNLIRKTLKSLGTVPETSIVNISEKIEKPIYLKPGKSWTRSLSILNTIQDESDLEKLSIGKGKQWRQSVIEILNMQKKGVFQSCIRKTESDKNLEVVDETISKCEHELANKKGRTSDSISLGRLTRRISVRVVPINKTVKSIEDAPFLEVYDPGKSSVSNIENDDIDGHITNEYVVSTAKEVILERCLQQDYILFSTYFSDSYLDHCRKIGEGVYGEVFLYELCDEKTVIKIIPIEGNEYVNGEPQKKFHEILSEIVIAMELQNLRYNTKYNTDGFVEVKNIKCLKGKYPKKLVDLWTIYDEEKHSENDCPSMFNENQLYIILELGHGGQDLEAFVFPTADEAHALFIQAALALAVAEKAVEFEHRDLHWGNILISQTTESHVHYKLGKKHIRVGSKGVKVSIIDFTLSRVTYQGCSVFNDLASDPSLFTAQGEYQFEIYRLMKDKIKNNWSKFEPYTNILWLHYTLDKMITAVRYRKRNLRIHKNGIIKLKELKNVILSYKSAFDFVSNCQSIESLLGTVSGSKLPLALKKDTIIT
ncbi:haspin isoform X2 [Megalopta genalis]|uniref:haspin isoform X2 n=1 Tax=Megalopta genalis TaxID=115081 RepID=UPI003FD40341